MRDLGTDIKVLHIVTWLWGSKYPDVYVDRLVTGIARNCDEDPHNIEIVVCEPWPQDQYLTLVPGCMARLRTFDPEWQAEVLGAEQGDRIVVLDLDLVITGSLDGLFDRDEPFVILQGVHTANPTPYNGSVWMLRAGYRPDVWEDFSLEAAQDICVYMYPDDQMWMHHKIPDAAAFGPKDGVYAFMKPGWPNGMDLPKDARIVAFPGSRDPCQFQHLPWIKHHWIS